MLKKFIKSEGGVGGERVEEEKKRKKERKKDPRCYHFLSYSSVHIRDVSNHVCFILDRRGKVVSMKAMTKFDWMFFV